VRRETTRVKMLELNTCLLDVLADIDGSPLPHPAKPINFHTFPDPRIPTGSHFRFVVSSCATPNFPYLPLHGRRIKGFDLLADYLWPSKTVDADGAPDTPSPEDVQPPAEFMLFLGDFIYADVPMYFGDNVEAYRRFYRRNYNSDSMRKVYERLRKSAILTYYLFDELTIDV
jgi:alkaline phosphatase D